MNIVLYQPKIPQNTGNIARLCAATKTTLILIHPLGFKTDDRYMRRAGLDYWDKVNVVHCDSMEDFHNKYPDARCFYATKSGKHSYTDIEFREDDFLVFGSETLGLPPEIIEKNIDATIRIPMWGDVRCLNLSSSAAIVLYEAYRQMGKL